jgi:hypothetical protein
MDYISRIRNSLPTNPFTAPSRGAAWDPEYSKLIPFYRIKNIPGTEFKRALNNQLCFTNASGNALDKNTRAPVSVGDNEQVFVKEYTFNNLNSYGGKRKTRKNKKSKKSRKPRRKSTYRRRR